MRHIVHDVVCRHILSPILDRTKLFLPYTLSPPGSREGPRVLCTYRISPLTFVKVLTVCLVYMPLGSRIPLMWADGTHLVHFLTFCASKSNLVPIVEVVKLGGIGRIWVKAFCELSVTLV